MDLKHSARVAFGDQFPQVENDGVVGDCREQLQPMLDQHHADLHLMREVADDAVELIDLGVDEAGCRFVEQHDARPAHQQTGEQQLTPVQRLKRTGQRRHRHAQADLVRGPLCMKPREERLIGLPCGAEHLGHGKRVGRHWRLIGAAEAEAGAGKQFQRRDVASAQHHPAAVGSVAAGEHLE